MFGVKFKTARIDPVRDLERYLAKRPRVRGAALLCSSLCLLAALLLFGGRDAVKDTFRTAILSLSIVMGFTGVVVFAAALKAYKIADYIELQDVRRSSDKIQQRIGAPNVFDIVQLSLSQLSEYYTINKSQARKSFNFSVMAVALGLVTIVAGVWLIYSRRLGVSVGTISAISGLLLHFFGL